MDKKQAIGADIRSRADRLSHLFKMYAQICDSDDQTISTLRRHHFTRYLCVLTSGFLEASVHSVYNYYIDTHLRPTLSPAQLKKLHNQVGRLYNFNRKNLLSLTRAVNAPWERHLVSTLHGNMEYAIDTVISYRNLIAHGKNSKGLIQGDLERHFANIVTLANLLHSYL